MYYCIVHVQHKYHSRERKKERKKIVLFITTYRDDNLFFSRGGEVRDGFAAAFYLWLTTYSHSSRESKNRYHLLYILDLGLFLLRYIHAQKVSIRRCISLTKKNLVKRQKKIVGFCQLVQNETSMLHRKAEIIIRPVDFLVW